MRYRAVTSQADWPSYNGQTNGSRYSPLAQITASNVSPHRSQVDLQPAQHVAPAGDAGRRRRRDVCHQPPTSATRSTPGAGRENLALPAPAHQGPRRQRGRRHQPRRAPSRATGVFMVTDHAHVIALNRFTGGAAVGNRDGRLAPELQRDRSAAGRGQPRRDRHVGRR